MNNFSTYFKCLIFMGIFFVISGCFLFDEEKVEFERIEIKTPAEKIIYNIGDDFDTKGLSIYKFYSNGTREEQNITKENISGFESNTPGIKVIKIKLENKETYYTVRVADKTGENYSKYIEKIGFEGKFSISNDSKYIAIPMNDKKVRIFDLDKGSEQKVLDMELAEYENIDEIEYIFNSKKIACTSFNKEEMTVFDIETEEKSFSFKDEIIEESNRYIFTNDGKYILRYNENKTLNIWDIETGKIEKELVIGIGFYKVIISPDSKYIAGIGYYEDSIKIIELDTKKEIRKFYGEDMRYAVYLKYSIDGKYIVTASRNKIYVYEINSGESKEIINESNINSFDISSDGKYIITGCKDKTINVWEIETGKRLKVLPGYRDEVKCVKYSLDNKYIIGGTSDEIKIWDKLSGKELKSFPENTPTASLISINSSGEYIALADKNKVSLWDKESGKRIHILESEIEEIKRLEYTNENKIVISGNEEIIEIWDGITAKNEVKIEDEESYYIENMACSPDGKYIASSSGVSNIKIWRTETGEKIKTISGNNERIYSMTYSPDGKYIAVGMNNDVKIIDAASGIELKKINTEITPYKLKYTPNGKFIIVDNNDYFKVFDISTKVEKKIIDTLYIDEKYSRFKGIDYSPCGKYIAFIKNKNCIEIVDIENFRKVVSIKEKGNFETLSYTSDGKNLIVAGYGMIIYKIEN